MRLSHCQYYLTATLLVAAVIHSATAASRPSTELVNEREILLELYQATGGPSWNENEGWVVGAGADDDYCGWTGVICTGEADMDLFQRRQRRRHLEETDEGDDDRFQSSLPSNSNSDNNEEYRVMGLDLSHNFLQGRTPASLWKLPLLQYLNVNHNEKLQVDFSSVQDANHLSIVKAAYTATASLAGLDHASLTLNVVHLTACPLRSEIPVELLALTNLRDLQLSSCQLEGKLDGIQALTNLRNLNLFDNQLRGTLPNEMIAMGRLQKFSLSRNQLTGDLHVVDALADMQELYLAENQFKGKLPSLSAMPRLGRVFLNQNLLTGPIPPQFLLAITTWEPNLAETAGWIRVDISKNQLTGTIPASLDILSDLSMDFDWQDNQWTNVSQALCDNQYWNRGAVLNYGCNGLVCPPGTYSLIGHASNQYGCHECESAEYYGTTTCVPESDKAALLALFRATDGNNWYNHTGWKLASDWLGLYDTGDICEWYGVECYQVGDVPEDENAAGRVRRIDLSGNNLVGEVPEEIFTMEYLETLVVSRNPQLDVPLTMMEASEEIRYLDISQTATVNFDGLERASPWFAYLVADGLTVGGTLPRQILNLTSLKLLSMSECELIGTIPDELGLLTHLNELYLFDNHLRGTIPASIGDMVELRFMSLAQNQLEGPLPVALDSLQKLQALSLSDQVSKGGGLTGSLTTFRYHPFLRSLQLSRNLLTGTVPAQLLEGTESLQMVLKVGLANNRLTGKVPGELARFPSMDLELQGNRFTELDERLCGNPDWMNGLVGEFGCDAILCPVGTGGGRQQFEDAPCKECPVQDDANHVATGVSPNWMGQVHCKTKFSMEDSDEQGLIELLFQQTGGDQWKNNGNWLLQKKEATSGSSPHVCDWYGISCDESRSIVGISLGANNLQGTFPTELYMLPKLELLSLFGNPSLDIPLVGIDKAQNLRQLILDSTGLTSLRGIGRARSLTELNVEDNGIEGALPEELSRLINLKSLSISKNSFEGSIPYWIGSLLSLQTFLAAENQFEGPLPDFANFRRISYLDLSKNKLAGDIPLTFLDSADPLDKIVVDLSENNLGGTLPRELYRLGRLTIHLQDNQISDIDRELCQAIGWNDYDVQKYGCDGILCPAGSSSVTGRQTSNATQCTPCEDAEFMGSTACFASARSVSGASRLHHCAVAAIIVTITLGLTAFV